MKHIATIALLSASWVGLSAISAQAAGFRADLDPLNNSGVTGTVLFDLSEDMNFLTVTFDASGFEPNQPHVGHIHGAFMNGTPVNSVTPTLDQDTDGDGFIELAEGLPVYGPIILPLETVNTPGGNASYTKTYDLRDGSIFASNVLTSDMGDTFSRSDLLPLTLREVVYHGMTVEPGKGAGTPGEVDGANGYLAVLPVSAGEIVAADTATSVPEPTSIAGLVLAGIGGIYGTRRRQKSSVQ